MNVSDDDALLSSGATILTYDPPSGSTALVYAISCFLTTGAADAAVVTIRLVRADAETLDIGTIVFGDMDTKTALRDYNITLNDGDSLALVVTTVDATETADVCIFARELYAT